MWTHIFSDKKYDLSTLQRIFLTATKRTSGNTKIRSMDNLQSYPGFEPGTCFLFTFDRILAILICDIQQKELL